MAKNVEQKLPILATEHSSHLRFTFSIHACNIPYLHFCLSSDSKTEPKCTFRLNKQTHDLNHAHSLMTMQQSALSVRKHPLGAQEAFLARNESPKK